MRGGGPQTPAASLSGGNQQKVVIAREVSRDPRVLVAAQPTRGLDVGAIEFVHRRLVAERDEGRAILLVSFELDEVLSLSDRILVLYEGRIVGEYTPDVSEEELGIAMTGGAGSRRRRMTRAAAAQTPPPAPAEPEEYGSVTGLQASRPRRRRPRPGRRDVPRLLRSAAWSSPSPDGAQPVRDLQGDLRGHRADLVHPRDRRHGRGGARPPADADHHDAADPDRARGRLRVPLRHVQHRRPGPVLGRPLGRDLRRHAPRRRMPRVAAHRPRDRRRARSPARSGAGSPGSSRRPPARTR